MRSMSILQMAGGVVVAGVVAAGATAVTGAGVTLSGTATDQWVGGTATQTISGASVTGVTYAYVDAAKTQVSQIDIVITGAPSKTVTITPSGTFSTSPLADEWKCSGTNGVVAAYHATAVALSFPVAGASDITCVPAENSSNTHVVGGGTRYVTGLSTLAITAA
jgi:hypothetical protein